jgi:hypothetical protein
MQKNYQSKSNIFGDGENKPEYKPIDYNSVLFQTIIDIKTLIPRVRANLLTEPGLASVLLSSIETLWILMKHYARVSQQEDIDAEFDKLNGIAFGVYSNQRMADIFFRRCVRLFDSCMQVLRENDKLEHLNLHGSIR